MNEFELRNRLSAEMAKNAHLHRELERAEHENSLLHDKIDALNNRVYDLQQATLDYFKAIRDLEDEYQNHLYRLEKEKHELLEIIENIKKAEKRDMTDFEYRNCLNQEIARRSHMQKELEKAMEENRNLSKQITILKQENQKLHSQALNYITSMQETENKFQEQISILKSENETLRNLLKQVITTDGSSKIL